MLQIARNTNAWKSFNLSLSGFAPVKPVIINKFTEEMTKTFTVTTGERKPITVELWATGVKEVSTDGLKLTRNFTSYTYAIKVSYKKHTKNVFMTSNDVIINDVYNFVCKYPQSVFNREKNLLAYKELLISNINAKSNGLSVMSLKEIENSDPVNNIHIGMMSFEKNHVAKKPRATKKTVYLTIGTNFDLKTELSTGEVKTIEFKNDDLMLEWIEKLEKSGKYKVVYM